MSNKPVKDKNPTLTITVTTIICATILITVILGFTLAYEQLQRTTEFGDAANSPIDAVLKAQLTTIVTFFTGLVGVVIGGIKVYRKITRVEEKTEKVEKQTNGRSHVRDAERDLTVKVLSAIAEKQGIDVSSEIAGLLNAPHTADTPPEDQFTDEEKRLQQEMMDISRRMAEARQNRINP